MDRRGHHLRCFQHRQDAKQSEAETLAYVHAEAYQAATTYYPGSMDSRSPTSTRLLEHHFHVPTGLVTEFPLCDRQGMAGLSTRMSGAVWDGIPTP